MGKRWLVLVSLCIIGWAKMQAQENGFGFGLFLGEPTGFNGKLWLTQDQAVDVGFGWTVGGFNLDRYDASDRGGSRFHIHADYLWHDYDLIRTSEKFSVYYGFGARMNSGAGYSSSFGVRAIGGIAWVSQSIPIDIFIELTPVFQVNPSSRFGINGGIGCRYYFH